MLRRAARDSQVSSFTDFVAMRRTAECRARVTVDAKTSACRPKLTQYQAREALKRVAAGEPLCGIAPSSAVNHSRISRLKTRHAAQGLAPERVQSLAWRFHGRRAGPTDTRRGANTRLCSACEVISGIERL